MSRSERGAGVLVSLIVSASCILSPAPRPSPTPLASLAGSDAVVNAALFLSKVAAYDYALAGSFAGERSRTVTADRYVEVLAGDHDAVLTLKDQVVAAAFSAHALAAPLIAAADELVGIEEDFQAVDVDDPGSFARVVAHVDAAWAAFGEIAKLSPNETLSAAIAHGTAWRVAVSKVATFAVLTQPYGSRDEADQMAGRIGSVELVADAAPFTIRVLTTADRATAAKRVGDLIGIGVPAAVVDAERYSFSRSGPDPLSELWREGSVDIPTWAQARRAAFINGGLVIVSADGETFSFDDAGKLWWHARLRPGPTFATASTDGRYVVVGGQFVQVLGADGRVFGAATRLPSAAAGAVWLARRKLFVAASQGPTGKPAGGGGGVVALRADGSALDDPFPLVTPAAGPALAGSPGRDDVFIATTTNGNTDVEAIRPDLDDHVRTVLRVPTQVVDLALDDDGRYAAISTAGGTYRFEPGATKPSATLTRIADPARDIAFGHDGALYLVFEDRVVAYDRDLRTLWIVPLGDGRRIVVARRLIVQDGLPRALAIDPASGGVDVLAPIGDLNDVAVSPDGARVALLADGQRAVVFQLP